MNSLIITAIIAALLVPWVFAVLIILIASWVRRDRAKRRQDFLTAVGLTVLMGVGASLNLWVSRHVPYTIDARLWHWDEALRIDHFALVYFMQAHATLWDVMQLVYVSLPIVMAIAWIVEQNFILRRAVAMVGVLGWVFAAIFPAVGPHWYLDGYTVTARHCIPALEWTWALLLALNARSRLRIPLWVYSILLAVASILLGEHYVADLILALPYALAMQRVAASCPIAAKFTPAPVVKTAGEQV